MSVQNLTLCSPRPSSGLDPNKPVVVMSSKPSSIPPNHVLLRVDRFGFSANNTTYQALGEAPHFRYFEFNYPPTVWDVSKKTHGLIPVWGFADVIESTHSGIQVGERVYGYFAPTRYLLLPVSPNDINNYYFYVPRPHLPADRRPYNQVTRCSTDVQYHSAPELEDMTMLYRPLFWTSYWCEDWLHASSYRGNASHILISSASAKTAFTLAHCIRRRRAKGGLSKSTKIIGLTSARNLSFTKGLGLYDEVFTYDELESAGALKTKQGEKWIYVDVAGVSSLNERIFKHYEPTGALVAGVTLGMSSIDPADANSVAGAQLGHNDNLASPGKNKVDKARVFGKEDMESFFMVEWLDLRRTQLSVKEIVGMQREAWDALLREGRGWVKLERVYGAKEVQGAYERVIKGKVGPETGYIWSLWDKEEHGQMERAKL